MRKIICITHIECDSNSMSSVCVNSMNMTCPMNQAEHLLPFVENCFLLCHCFCVLVAVRTGIEPVSQIGSTLLRLLHRVLPLHHLTSCRHLRGRLTLPLFHVLNHGSLTNTKQLQGLPCTPCGKILSSVQLHQFNNVGFGLSSSMLTSSGFPMLSATQNRRRKPTPCSKPCLRLK